MFRLMKLKPPHGWSAVGWELMIVTLGVLIALGAQQTVEAANWRRDVADFRESVRAEMGRNLWTYPHRGTQKNCINARLDELQQWLDSWRAGRPLMLTGPIGIPVSAVIRTSAWDGRDPATLAHMARSERVEYGFLYSEFANNEVHRLDERATWIELASFDRATLLDHQDQMKLQGLIFRARLRDSRIDANADRFLKRAAKIGLKLIPEPDLVAYGPELCRPILATQTKRAAGK